MLIVYTILQEMQGVEQSFGPLSMTYTAKKDGYLTLLRLSQLELMNHLTPTLRFHFSYTLETERMHGFCRVSPK